MIEPLVTSPRSARSRFEIAFSVVVLPAPLAPRSATMPAFGTVSDTPLSTRIRLLYTTSILLTLRIVSPALAATAEVAARTGSRPTASAALTGSPPGVIAALSSGRPAAVVFHIVPGGRHQQRLHHRGHRRDVVGLLHPLRAVPLLDKQRAVAVVIAAAERQRLREAAEAQFLESRRRQID